MANVQPDKFTRIANELLEEVAKFKFNGTQFRIIMTVWRYTYGFRRKQHEMSLGFIENATGVDRSRIKKELNKLIETNVIEVVKEATFDKSRILSFNKDYEQWQIESQGSKKTEGSKTTTPQGSNKTTPQGSKTTPKKESIKENIKEKQIEEIFNHYISKNIINHKKLTSDMKNEISKALKNFDYEVIIQAIDNYAEVFHSNKYWFKQKYTLENIMRKKDIKQFCDEADPLYNFAHDKYKNDKPKREVYESNSVNLLDEMGGM